MGVRAARVFIPRPFGAADLTVEEQVAALCDFHAVVLYIIVGCGLMPHALQLSLHRAGDYECSDKTDDSRNYQMLHNSEGFLREIVVVEGVAGLGKGDEVIASKRKFLKRLGVIAVAQIAEHIVGYVLPSGFMRSSVPHGV